ncbi:MAG: hypothetical protein WB773_14335 [Isosphaeraceae bacterium]
MTCPVTGAGSLLQVTAWFVRVTGVPRMRKFRGEPSGISTSAREVWAWRQQGGLSRSRQLLRGDRACGEHRQHQRDAHTG